MKITHCGTTLQILNNNPSLYSPTLIIIYYVCHNDSESSGRGSYFPQRSASMLLVTVFFLVLFSVSADESSQLPGHMEPLGSHMPPNQLERLVAPPSPLQFAEYVTRRQPVVMEQLMRDTDVIKNWQNDDYLRFAVALCISSIIVTAVGRGLDQIGLL